MTGIKNMAAEKKLVDTIEVLTIDYKGTPKRAEYFDAVEKLLQGKNKKQALRAMREAMIELPDDPFIKSYYGYLMADVEKKFDEGIRLCKDIVDRLGFALTPEEKKCQILLYLNLGRAYLAAKRKKLAIITFRYGLKVDNTNNELLWEIRKLGSRRKPVIPFLSRKNPINKYLGLLISKSKD